MLLGAAAPANRPPAVLEAPPANKPPAAGGVETGWLAGAALPSKPPVVLAGALNKPPTAGAALAAWLVASASGLAAGVVAMDEPSSPDVLVAAVPSRPPAVVAGAGAAALAMPPSSDTPAAAGGAGAVLVALLSKVPVPAGAETACPSKLPALVGAMAGAGAPAPAFNKLDDFGASDDSPTFGALLGMLSKLTTAGAGASLPESVCKLPRIPLVSPADGALAEVVAIAAGAGAAVAEDLRGDSSVEPGALDGSTVVTVGAGGTTKAGGLLIACNADVPVAGGSSCGVGGAAAAGRAGSTAGAGKPVKLAPNLPSAGPRDTCSGIKPVLCSALRPNAEKDRGCATADTSDSTKCSTPLEYTREMKSFSRLRLRRAVRRCVTLSALSRLSTEACRARVRLCATLSGLAELCVAAALPASRRGSPSSVWARGWGDGALRRFKAAPAPLLLAVVARRLDMVSARGAGDAVAGTACTVLTSAAVLASSSSSSLAKDRLRAAYGVLTPCSRRSESVVEQQA